jgi:hypothetical protein
MREYGAGGLSSSQFSFHFPRTVLCAELQISHRHINNIGVTDLKLKTSHLLANFGKGT